MPQFRCPAALVVAISLTALGPTVAARAEPGEIKGQDVMGDKSRSANDGWSQAPVPREQSAAKDAPDPGGNSTAQNRDRSVPNSGSSDNSGTDPQQTLDHRTPGPSVQNPAAPKR